MTEDSEHSACTYDSASIHMIHTDLFLQ